MTLEPDGTATGCNPVEVGSTPTGVSCPNRWPEVQTSGYRQFREPSTRHRVFETNATGANPAATVLFGSFTMI